LNHADRFSLDFRIWSGANRLAKDESQVTFHPRENSPMMLRVLLIVILLLILARAAYSDESCVKESVRFADCVDNALPALGEMAAGELATGVGRVCALERAAYESCGGFEKSTYATQFIRSRIELSLSRKTKFFARKHDSAALTAVE
jgi:hypothetical protein